MTRKDATAKKALLDRIVERSVPLREIENCRSFNLLRTGIEQLVSTGCLGEVEPPTFGFTSTESFLEASTQFLPSTDHWLLSILVSKLIEWVWRETSGEERVSWVDHLGTMPVVVPHPHYRERMGVLVRRILEAIEDQPLVLELKSDLDDLVYSNSQLTGEEVNSISTERV